MIGDYDRALDEYLTALEHYRETLSYRHRGDIVGALDLVRPALDIVRGIGHRRMEGAVLAKIGPADGHNGLYRLNGHKLKVWQPLRSFFSSSIRNRFRDAVSHCPVTLSMGHYR